MRAVRNYRPGVFLSSPTQLSRSEWTWKYRTARASQNGNSSEVTRLPAIFPDRVEKPTSGRSRPACVARDESRLVPAPSDA
jgi:hypothetical protein